MKDSLKILDKFDKKENIYKLILQYAEKGHEILSVGTASVSDDSVNILDLLLTETGKDQEQDGYKKTSEESR